MVLTMMACHNALGVAGMQMKLHLCDVAHEWETVEVQKQVSGSCISRVFFYGQGIANGGCSRMPVY